MVAKEISSILNTDIDEITDKRNREGVLGWMWGGHDSAFKKNTEIEFKNNPFMYELVVIGTPIWAFTITPAIRTYLSNNKFKKVAFFCTSAGSGIKRTLKEMEKLTGKPIAVLSLKSKAWSVKLDLEKDNNHNRIKEFCKKLIS